MSSTRRFCRTSRDISDGPPELPKTEILAGGECLLFRSEGGHETILFMHS
jgi:hypothetical protein